MRFGRAQEIGQRTVVLARFPSSVAAGAAREALESIIETASREVAELFEARGGEADAAEVTAIFARHGLGEAIGWEVEHPVATRGTDLAWTLPPGADADDADQLLRELGAVNVVAQAMEGDDEEWRAAPHPMVLPVPGEEIDPFDGDDDDPASTEVTRNRTLH
jgi:hypothetical protein